MKEADHELLREMVARNAGAVISLPSAGMLRHCKTRFLAPDDNGFWIEAPCEEIALVNELIGKAQPVGMSIKANPNKIVFTTLIQQYLSSMQINAQTAVDALLMAWPDQVVAIQRRADYRVSVPSDAEVQLQVWRIPEHHVLRDRPQPSTQINATMRDLSVGGFAFCWNKRETDPMPVNDQRLRIAIGYAGGDILVEGRVRHFRPLPSGQIRIGAQFRKLESDLEGRQSLAALTQLVGLLQRDEIRRHRLTRAS